MKKNKIHSIAAYRLNIKEYRKREIIDKNNIIHPFEEIISYFNENMNKTFVGNNSQRAIKIANYSKSRITKNCILHNFLAKSGKYGETLEVVNIENDDTKVYDDNYVGLYGHNVFCYEYEDEIIFVFHRISNSGCKTVFVESFNTFLKTNYDYYGVFIPCYYPKSLNINYDTIMPRKVILTTFVKNDSSDGSEKKVKKKSKEVTLYLDNQNTLYETIKSFIKRKITKEELKLALINYDEAYSQASITINIGNGTSRTIECENLFDKLIDYDITSIVNDIEDNKRFDVEDLKKICTNYAKDIYDELEDIKKEKIPC